MKAVISTTYGPPAVLRIAEVQKPSPGDDEILVKISATTVSAADIRIRSFKVPIALWIPARLVLGITKPKRNILGVELAGTVEAVGRNVSLFKTGDEVFAASLQKFGAYAEYITLNEDAAIARKPKTISLEEAASLPIGARTALHFLRKAGIRQGQSVLIYGASGSVGTYAVQLAKYFGAKVTGVCGPGNLDLVKSLGADAVLNYTRRDFEAHLTNYDIVFVAVDKISFSKCNRHLKKEGVYINIATAGKTPEMIWAQTIHGKKIIVGENVPEGPELLNFLARLVEADKLRPIIDRRYKLSDIRDAHTYVEQGHKRGNVVVQID